MDDDTEPPMDGPDASDGDGADASDAGEPRLLESSHRAISDGLGGFVFTADLPALDAVSKTVRNSRLLVAIKRAVTTRWTACAASKRARSRLQGQLESGRAGRSREETLPQSLPLKSSLILPFLLGHAPQRSVDFSVDHPSVQDTSKQAKRESKSHCVAWDSLLQVCTVIS